MNAGAPDLRADCETTAFRTLDADLDDGLREGDGTVKRICIATPDILGPVKNGGIGTAYHHMARLLAEQGHEVVIAYVNRNATHEGPMEQARALYAGFGVAFVPVVPRAGARTELARVPAPAWTLLEWLRASERPFDIVHVPDWHGTGYGALLAKSLGLAFGETHFVVMGHSPSLWATEGSRQLVSSERELGWVFMERRSVELADTAICVSAHLLRWMRDAGYALPARSFVWPNPFPLPDPSPAGVSARAARNGAMLEEAVFFGRLEPRKGLVLFVDAIERLVRRGRAPARVTFLGGPSPRIDGPGLIRSAAESWPVEVRTITDFGAEEAVAYLSRPGRLAVIPSLLENSSMAVMECLHGGIPFVAATTGGTPELVASADHGRALVAPDHIALGERIAELAGRPLRAVRPRWDFGRSREVWSRWHAQCAPFEAAARRFAARARRAGAETPLVTVCIVHHERPELVRMAVDSVLAQDYPALEAVLVDDGSESAGALAALDALEAEFGARGWRVLRQENRFKGAARNAAAAMARGEWLLFLDDDNVLFPDAVSRLVRTALFSGADCVPAASIRFFGDGDPRTDSRSHGAPIRFLGAADAWSRFRNVVGDTCALVRNAAFEAVGGFSEEYRVGLDDLSFFNRLLHTGHRIEPVPDPLYYYRIGETSTKGLNRSGEAALVQVIAPYIEGRSGEERAFFSFVVGQADISEDESFESPRTLRMLAEYAMRRRYWPLACNLWEELREVAPEREEGYVRGTAALMEAGRLEEAETLAGEAVARFPEQPGGRVRQAEVAMRHEDWTLASARWEALRRAFPEQASGYLRGAAALAEAGRLDEAEALAIEAVARFPEQPGGHVQRAEVAMRREDWTLASARWEALRRAFPEQASGYLRGAAALAEAGRLDEAEALAGEAVARFPEQPGGHVQRAEVAMRREDWTLASARWEALRCAFPERTLGYVRGAAALAEAGRLDEAEALADEAVARFPEQPGGYVQRAEIAMQRKDWGKASACWEAMRRAFPEYALGYVRGTIALAEAGRLDEAEALADEAVARFPEQPGGYVQRAEIAMQRKDWGEASACWAAMRRAFPEHALGYVRGTIALTEAGRLDEAEAVAGEAVERFPEQPGGYVQRAEIAMRRKDWGEASACWAAMRRAFPEHALGYVRGTIALTEAGRLDEAEAVAGEAVERFPEQPGGYVQRAEVAMRRKDWGEASVRWAALRRAFPEYALGYVRGTIALTEAGRLDEAEAVAGEAVERFPGRPAGRVRRAEVAMRRKEWEEASARWAALRRAFPDHAAGFERGTLALMNAGRLAEAEVLADEAVERFRNRPSPHLRRAELAMRRRDWETACRFWGEARRVFPDQAAGFVRGAAALRRAGRREEADALAVEAKARFPEHFADSVQGDR